MKVWWTGTYRYGVNVSVVSSACGSDHAAMAPFAQPTTTSWSESQAMVVQMVPGREHSKAGSMSLTVGHQISLGGEDIV